MEIFLAGGRLAVGGGYFFSWWSVGGGWWIFFWLVGGGWWAVENFLSWLAVVVGGGKFFRWGGKKRFHLVDAQL